jgi:hypothetical protein
MGDERIIESRVFCQVFTQYMYQSQIVIRSASYISEKAAYIWARGFCPRGGIKT